MRREIATGILELSVERNDTGLGEEDVFDIAARANPKRGFLIVSKLIGRHVPTRPALMRDMMARLAERIDRDLPGPVLFLGMAETAVGLGQGVHRAWIDATGREDAWFIQSTRQTAGDMDVWAAFEEGHSHASSHLVHRPDDDRITTARSLVVVDDECSTGTTFVKAEEAMRRVLPALERVVDVVITDWAGPTDRERVSLVSGTMRWEPNGAAVEVPGANANSHGATTRGAGPGRQGYARLSDIHLARLPALTAGQRVTVVADGENAYDALRVAEACERRGAIAAVQSITRSPAHLGGAMGARALFTDAHGSGATCYSYNLDMHRPDLILVVGEHHGGQVEEMARATGHPRERVHLVRMGR